MPDFAHTFTIDEKNAYENQKGVQKGKEVGKILCHFVDYFFCGEKSKVCIVEVAQ